MTCVRLVGLFVWFRWWQTAFGDHLLDEFTAIATFVQDGLGDRLSDATKWQLLEVQGVPSQARLFAQSDNTWSTVVGYLQNKEHIFGNNPPYNNVNPVGCSLVCGQATTMAMTDSLCPTVSSPAARLSREHQLELGMVQHDIRHRHGLSLQDHLQCWHRDSDDTHILRRPRLHHDEQLSGAVRDGPLDRAQLGGLFEPCAVKGGVLLSTAHIAE